MNIKIQTVFIFAVSGYESVLRIIQIPKETLVEWKPGTLDRTNHDLIVRRIHRGYT